MKPTFTPQPGDAYTNAESNDRLVYISEQLHWVYSSGTGVFVAVDSETAVLFLNDPDWYLDVRDSLDQPIDVCMGNYEVGMTSDD